MQPQMAAKRIRIALCGDTAPCPVLGDYGRLRQLFTVLLDNAIKFSPEGSGVTVSISQAERCIVSIQDHGCGIAPEELSHIFDRFYHQHSSANCTGTGLGLPIAREIALRHQTELVCTSVLGEGTCFTLSFPAYKNGPSEAICIFDSLKVGLSTFSTHWKVATPLQTAEKSKLFHTDAKQ